MNILHFLSEYTSYRLINKTNKMSLEVSKGTMDIEVSEHKPRVEYAEYKKTHKEICDFYIMECKEKNVSFINYEDFINNFISYSQTIGFTKITKLNMKYLEDSFYSLNIDINQGIENIHLYSL